MNSKKQFYPVAILKNGILQIDGHMSYTDGHGKWLYVSEDGASVYMYNNVADMIRDVYRKYGDDDDFVVTGWDTEISRIDDYDAKYNYYNKRFED